MTLGIQGTCNSQLANNFGQVNSSGTMRPVTATEIGAMPPTPTSDPCEIARRLAGKISDDRSMWGKTVTLELADVGGPKASISVTLEPNGGLSAFKFNPNNSGIQADGDFQQKINSELSIGLRKDAINNDMIINYNNDHSGPCD